MIDIEDEYVEHLKGCILSIPAALIDTDYGYPPDVESEDELDRYIWNIKIQLTIFDRQFYDEIEKKVQQKEIPQYVIDFLDNNRFTGLELFCKRHCVIDCTPMRF